MFLLFYCVVIGLASGIAEAGFLNRVQLHLGTTFQFLWGGAALEPITVQPPPDSIGTRGKGTNGCPDPMGIIGCLAVSLVLRIESERQ